MKLAVVDHIGNPGGSSRVIRALVPAIKAIRPDVSITYFGNLSSVKREGLHAELVSCGVTFRELKSLRLRNNGIFGIKKLSWVISKIQDRFESLLSKFPTFLSGQVHKEIEAKVVGFDVAYFPWPFLLKCPRLLCPMVGTFHDFNYKYYFTGQPTFSKSQTDLLNNEMPIWLKHAKPIVSTKFIADEIGKYYPEHSKKVEIIYLAPMSTVTSIPEEVSKKIVREKLGKQKHYILYPTNLCSHKNLGSLICAVSHLKNRGLAVILVLTGPGTDRVNGKACGIGVDLGSKDQDVFGLGYISHLEMDSLIQHASVVVSTSLYEAGNGPGIDAWVRGVPVAMSNIPAFMEHLEVQGVKAEVFDPLNPEDIALKIENILTNPEKTKNEALESKQALSRITWEETARSYVKAFEKAINEYRTLG